MQSLFAKYPLQLTIQLNFWGYATSNTSVCTVSHSYWLATISLTTKKSCLVLAMERWQNTANSFENKTQFYWTPCTFVRKSRKGDDLQLFSTSLLIKRIWWENIICHHLVVDVILNFTFSESFWKQNLRPLTKNWGGGLGSGW